MGFPSVCYCVILPKPLILAVQLLDRVKLAVAVALFYLGLSSAEDYMYPLSPSSEFSAPTAFPVAPSVIKARLPAIRFSSSWHGNSEGRGEPVCAVCLGSLEARQEVRELGNCCHMFHKSCIDKWVDIGQITCPLCRAPLLPKRRGEKVVALDLVERIIGV